MGDDEMVRVRLARGVGERIVDVNLRKGDITRASPVDLLDMAQAVAVGEDKREISLMKGLVSSDNARVEAVDSLGGRVGIPYNRPIGISPIQRPIGDQGVQTLSLDYGTLFIKGD